MAATLLLLCSCSSDSDITWKGSVDTLSSGAVLVHNPSIGIWDSTEAWRLVEDLRVGTVDGTGPDVFGNIAALEVDALGRIYALENQAEELRVFAADGRHVRTIGRHGEGPGEFRRPFGLAWDPEHNLWVAESGNARYSAFDTTGRYLTQRPRRAGFFRMPFPGRFDTEGRLYDTGLDGQSGEETVIRSASDTAVLDTLPLPEYDEIRFEIPGVMSTVVPFAPTLIWRLDDHGGLWFGTTGEYRLIHRTFEGDTTLIVERDHDRVPVTSTERDSAIARLSWFTEQGGKIDPGKIPSQRPAFRGIELDDRGYLWVRRYDDDEDVAFDVFDPDGRFLGPVRSGVALPLYYPILFRGTSVYAVILDDQEVQYIVRLRIVGRQ